MCASHGRLTFARLVEANDRIGQNPPGSGHGTEGSILHGWTSHHACLIPLFPLEESQWDLGEKIISDEHLPYEDTL